MIEILPEQSTHEQLLNRVRSLARQLAEVKYTAEQVCFAFEAFTSICKVWRWLKKYDPREVKL